MPDIILRLPRETLARIDMLKARIELQERRSLHRSVVLLRILDAGCTVLEQEIAAPISAIESMAEDSSIAPDESIPTTPPIPQIAAIPETPAHPDLAEEVLEMLTGVQYDASRYKLGKLCRRRHEYEGTGQSLLYRRNSVCVACDREKVAERRAAKRQGTVS